MLTALEVGVTAQHIVDLGTGVGFLASRFAQQGAVATGIDISAEQIAEARLRCASLDVPCTFFVAPAEDTKLAPGSFDVATASQSWLYFDKVRAISEVKRILKPRGLLVLTGFGWLPGRDAIARASEELVLRHNPKWTSAGWSGSDLHMPEWAEADFELQASFVFHERIPFTRESWRGRFRACRGIGATLSRAAVEAFDRDHDILLRQLTTDHFDVLHRIEAIVLKLKA